ncbi:MAG: hypothetical protein ACRDBL_01720 [Rhabdaerophilum sp.]
MLSPSRFLKSALGAGLALLFAGSAAFAQYYYQPAPRHYPAPRYLPEPLPGTGGYSPHPGYHERRTYQDRRYLLEDNEDYRPRRRVNPRADYGYSRRDLGQVCVTSRGNCDVGALVPIGSGCRCHIPGFGRKAGQVGY